MSAGIDSMILVYAGIVPSNPDTRATDFDELHVRSKLLLHQLARRKDAIFLPTIAVSEILVPIPKAQRGILIAALSEKFVCAEFDLQAAAIAADLWSCHNDLPQDFRYENRRVLKADAMILASARAAGATEFYSNDRQCRALASLIMTAHELPTRDPEDMFAEGDIRRGDL